MPARPISVLATLPAAGVGLILALLPWQAPAQTAADMVPEVAGLMETLRLDETFAVMRDEGMAGATEMGEETFPGGSDARWAAKVDQIYDAGLMQDRFAVVFAGEMAETPELAAAAAEFFASDLGQRIVTLEIEGRRALMDDAVEEAARLAAADARADMDPRMILLDDIAEAGDLIEQNVAGALNANLAFFEGMAEAGGLPDMDDSMMTAQVWASEPQVRTDMENWLYPYLLFAYRPLSDAELQAYAEFWQTEAGQKLNQAMFQGFAAAFTPISRDLGRASATMMQGSDI